MTRNSLSRVRVHSGSSNFYEYIRVYSVYETRMYKYGRIGRKHAIAAHFIVLYTFINCNKNKWILRPIITSLAPAPPAHTHIDDYGKFQIKLDLILPGKSVRIQLFNVNSLKYSYILWHYISAAGSGGAWTYYNYSLSDRVLHCLFKLPLRAAAASMNRAREDIFVYKIIIKLFLSKLISSSFAPPLPAAKQR